MLLIGIGKMGIHVLGILMFGMHSMMKNLKRAYR